MKKVCNLQAIKDEEMFVRLLKEVWKDGAKTGRAHHQLGNGDIFQKYMPDFKKMMQEQNKENLKS